MEASNTSNESTFSAEASRSRAKTSLTRDAERGSTGSARVFGPSTPDSFASFDRGTSSWRTSQLSLLEEWAVFSETWPAQGTTVNGRAYELRTLVRPTSETASGWWPTPNSRDWKGPPGKGAQDRGGHQASLPAAAQQSKTTGSLNPEFVEWLMGFPVGWTEVD